MRGFSKFTQGARDGARKDGAKNECKDDRADGAEKNGTINAAEEILFERVSIGTGIE